MGSLKYIALVALIFSLSLAVFADTSNDAKDEVKPSEATDAIEPHQRGRGGCRLGCAGMACCSQPKAKAETETDVGVVDPQIRWRGCKYGCCGGKRFGRCRYCCRNPQDKMAKEEDEKKGEAKP